MERIHADTDRDYVMTAEEAKEYGVIDEIIEERSLVEDSAAVTAIK